MNNTTIIAGIVALIVIIGGVVMYSGRTETAPVAATTDKSAAAQQIADNQKNMDNQKIADEKKAADAKQDGVMVGGALMVRNLDIVDNAVNASNVTTVVAAVKAAGLVDTLKSAGPFTVFAPTNAAFDKLPAGTVATLLKPENKAKLTAILTYHVVAGRYTAADLKDGMKLKTVNGEVLMISMKNGKILINGSTMIETADVISSNGVTHVIDSVLLPK